MPPTGRKPAGKGCDLYGLQTPALAPQNKVVGSLERRDFGEISRPDRQTLPSLCPQFSDSRLLVSFLLLLSLLEAHLSPKALPAQKYPSPSHSLSHLTEISLTPAIEKKSDYETEASGTNVD